MYIYTLAYITHMYMHNSLDVIEDTRQRWPTIFLPISTCSSFHQVKSIFLDLLFDLLSPKNCKESEAVQIPFLDIKSYDTLCFHSYRTQLPSYKKVQDILLKRDVI